MGHLTRARSHKANNKPQQISLNEWKKETYIFFPIKAAFNLLMQMHLQGSVEHTSKEKKVMNEEMKVYHVRQTIKGLLSPSGLLNH